MSKKCSRCKGTGRIASSYRCPACFGEGYRLQRQRCPNKCERGFYRVVCPSCHGLGYGNVAVEDSKEYISFGKQATCTNCNGSGKIRAYCPCKGSKYITSHTKCQKCNGTGQIQTTRPCPACRGQ